MAHLPYDIVNTMDMIGGKCIVNPKTVVDIPGMHLCLQISSDFP